jgi:hypothetical protein
MTVALLIKDSRSRSTGSLGAAQSKAMSGSRSGA